MQYDYTIWIPRCPESLILLPENMTRVESDAPRLSSACICVFIAILSTVLGILVSVKYNSIIVYTQRITTKGISNILWLLYFLATTVTFALRALFFAFGAHSWTLGDFVEIISRFSYDLAILGCSLALNHHRCAGKSDGAQPQASSPEQTSLNADDEAGGSESDRLLPQPQLGPGVVTQPGASPLKGICAALVPSVTECVLLVLFLVNYIMAYLGETFCHTVPYFKYYCLGTTHLQALPILVLTIVIMLKRVFGPEKKAKVCLLFACLFQLLLLDPIATWGVLFPHTCIPGIKIISYYDLTLLLSVLPLALFFAFLVQEYGRQKQECMYQFIKQTDSGVEYRPF